MPRSRDLDGDPVVLRRTIERALRRDDAPSEIVPMLERLQRIALEGSDERTYADRRLAEILLETAPWRAAVHIRRLALVAPEEDATWALMGLAQALLGHYKFACSSYRRALALSPNNPWYSHNLGHLLDVALDRPRDAVKHLERAYKRVDDEPAIACSYIHALWRAGDLDEARKVLDPLVASGGRYDPDVIALAAELDRSASRASRARQAIPQRLAGKRAPLGAGPSRRDRAAKPPIETLRRAHRALVARAAAPLALSAARRARALGLLTDYASTHVVRDDGETERAILAGAAVLAIGRVDRRSPLPYAAVAARLGVPAARLRARVRAVIAALSLVEDDPRYRHPARG